MLMCGGLTNPNVITSGDTESQMQVTLKHMSKHEKTLSFLKTTCSFMVLMFWLFKFMSLSIYNGLETHFRTSLTYFVVSFISNLTEHLQLDITSVSPLCR